MKEVASLIQQIVPESLQWTMDLAQEKGASSWLTSLPIEEFGISHHKGAFKHAFTLRYGWSLFNIPAHCVCGTFFMVQHALSCPKGGLPTNQNNEVQDLTAKLIQKFVMTFALSSTYDPSPVRLLLMFHYH